MTEEILSDEELESAVDRQAEEDGFNRAISWPKIDFYSLRAVAKTQKALDDERYKNYKSPEEVEGIKEAVKLEFFKMLESFRVGQSEEGFIYKMPILVWKTFKQALKQEVKE